MKVVLLHVLSHHENPLITPIIFSEAMGILQEDSVHLDAPSRNLQRNLIILPFGVGSCVVLTRFFGDGVKTKPKLSVMNRHVGGSTHAIIGI
jgi:hypothetical protein